jgi:hypothetical protein
MKNSRKTSREPVRKLAALSEKFLRLAGWKASSRLRKIAEGTPVPIKSKQRKKVDNNQLRMFE